MKKILILFILAPCLAFAQDDLLAELEKDTKSTTEYTFATFKGTRLANGHSIETKNAGSLEFIFAHRFGAINGGSYEMFGLDEALVRLGLDYGITDRLSFSFGRNSFDKTMDSYLKFKLLRQSTGEKVMPFSATVLGGLAYKLTPRDNFRLVDRFSYTGQLLLARKFSRNFSFQLMPTFVHKNAVVQSQEDNNQVALGLGGRIKLTKSVAITSEYYYNFSEKDNSPYFNPLAFGIDIETGGHVFQLILTNAVGLTERAFITETRDDFFDGDIHLGFNVTRTFQLKKNK
ncbi:MAG TPA: DUF5777 family beta-barrel protein [Chryseolinea sp.]|nr:DUF5777 family beta-barrel protein [Chryseolinea sp.]